MSAMNLKVLMIAEQCNPDWVSVPLVCYNFYREISQIVDVKLVTHERNRKGFEGKGHTNIAYIPESPLMKKYHAFLMEQIFEKERLNWPLYNALSYPIYAEFNRRVYQGFRDDVQQGTYDIVHAITPMMPRYPVSLVKACQQTPLLLGPVNGGVPFPKGFKETAKKENVFWNFLKPLGRYLVPGYIQTYKKADKILSGSTYTLEMLKRLFSIPEERIELLFENGISKNFLIQNHDKKKQPRNSDKVELLFVGRLVPYKGADIVIEALGRLDPQTKAKIALTIVGEGSERRNLELRTQELNLKDFVKFAGWVEQQETFEYYSKADIFCFPSIREFGGAVVMEAMACGLPCIVVNNGGIAEYVTDNTGFKLEPISREFLIQEMASKIKLLVEDEHLRERMSVQASVDAQAFEWSAKARKMVEIYQNLLERKNFAVS
jgi:glycosyltransferase involved in cell wall biosynthesis